jgi:hypothetical protein
LHVKKRFTPEVLGVTASTAFFVILFEILFIKLGSYLLNVQSTGSLYDLVAYSGYKFVPLIATLGLKFFTRGWIVYSFFLYSMLAFGFFTVLSFSFGGLFDRESLIHGKYSFDHSGI